MRAMSRSFVAVALVSAAAEALHLSPASAAARQPAPTSRSRVALSRTLAPMDGRELRVKIVEVTYAPGGANASHTHPCPVVGYVLEGSVRMRVNDGPEAIYKGGDTFYEEPGDIHQTSANASGTEPARFLAYFVCDREVTQLSVPALAPKDPRGWR
jgi:quercetin dioxygenase-like cupin family protein